MIERNLYIEQLKPFIDKPQIKMLINILFIGEIFLKIEATVSLNSKIIAVKIQSFINLLLISRLVDFNFADFFQ